MLLAAFSRRLFSIHNGRSDCSNSPGGACNTEITAEDNAHKKPTNVDQL
jgi:hypothetical protein